MKLLRGTRLIIIVIALKGQETRQGYSIHVPHMTYMYQALDIVTIHEKVWHLLIHNTSPYYDFVGNYVLIKA